MVVVTMVPLHYGAVFWIIIGVGGIITMVVVTIVPLHYGDSNCQNMNESKVSHP